VVKDLSTRSVSSFDVEFPNDGELKAKPASVDDVVLPADHGKGGRIDVSVEERKIGYSERRKRQRTKLCPDVIKQNFHTVAYENSRPCKIII